MSQTTIVAETTLSGVLTTFDSVKLSDATGTYGVKRLDTDAVVVADDTAMTEVSTGVYTYTFTDPAAGLTYEYVIEAVYNGITTRETGQKPGGGAGVGSLYDWLAHVLPYVGGCPYEVVRQNLRLAFQEFCAESGVWREEIAIETEEDENTYDLTHSWEAVIMQIRYVERGDKPNRTQWGAAWMGEDKASVLISPTPDEANDGVELAVGVTYKAKATATTGPAWLLDDWGSAIAAGAVNLIKRIPKTPYSDQRGAAEFGAQFLAGIGSAKAHVLYGGGDGHVVARGGFFC